jgi:hypothetical protein
LALICFLAALALPASALASTWTAHQLGGEAAKATVFGISCPTASLCVAVGNNNTIATSTDPTGDAGAWQIAHPGEGAVGIPHGTFNGHQIRAVSCPSSQFCVAASFEGLIYTSTDPTGGAEAWRVADLDGEGPNTHFYGVSCPSPSFCAASAGGAKIATSTNPTGGAGAWSVTQLEGPLELRGISCVSPSLCVAVGDDGEDIRPALSDNGEILTSTDPLAGAWRRVPAPAAQGNLYGVSCPSPVFCLSGDLLGNLVFSTAPATAAAWTPTDGGGSTQITAASCPSVSRCVAVDNNGDVLTSTDPTGGASEWSFTNLLPFPGIDETARNGMFGVSCPATSLCAVAGNEGQVFTSTDPFLPGPRPMPSKAEKKRRRHGPKRPRVTIARAPNEAERTSHGFGFRALFRSTPTAPSAASSAGSTGASSSAVARRGSTASAPATTSSPSGRLASPASGATSRRPRSGSSPPASGRRGRPHPAASR